MGKKYTLSFFFEQLQNDFPDEAFRQECINKVPKFGNDIDTVVYLKGCNMHCKWCHNPEGISSKPQLLFIENKYIHCGKCIKTCPEQHEPLLPFVDSFYVDIKHMDSGVNKKYTGCDNSLILENIQKLASVHNSVLIRIPLIPDVNDCLDNLVKTAKFAKSCSGGIICLDMDYICQHINKSVDEDNFAFYLL